MSTNTGSVDMTQGSLTKGIIKFSLPLIASNLLQVLFNMVDIAVVGRFCGSLALGAVGSTAMLVTLFTGVLIGFSGAVNAIAARCYGAKQTDVYKMTVRVSAVVMFLVGFIVLVLGELTTRPVLELLATKEELIDGAELYLRIYFLGMPAIAVFNYASAIFSAVGNTKTPLYYLGAAGVVNVVLNMVFVLCLGMDVDGVAYASVISHYLSAALIMTEMFITKGDCRFRLSELIPSNLKGGGHILKSIVILGTSAGAQNAIFYVANLFVQAGVNTFDAVMVAGNSAAVNSDSIVYNVMNAFYTACGSFVGQNYGADKKKRVLKSFLISTGFAFGSGLLLGGLFVISGREFMYLFADETAVIDAGMTRMVIMGLSYAVSAFMDGTIAASRGLGKSAVPTVMVILGSCVFRILWIKTVFAYFGTIESLYLLYIFSWTITALAEIIYFAAVYRRLGKPSG